MGKRFVPKPRPRCPTQKKAMYKTEILASKAMFRTWSHDPSVNIYDMHVYYHDECKSWHFGHISYFEKTQTKAQTLTNSNQM